MEAGDLFARGEYEWTNGTYSNATRALQQAVEIDPNLAEAHYYLGLTYQDLRRTPDACREIQEFLRRAPGTREASDAEVERRRSCR